MENALDFLRENNDVAFGTVENNRPNLRVFQVMLIKGHTLYFATSPRKEIFVSLLRIPLLKFLG